MLLRRQFRDMNEARLPQIEGTERGERIRRLHPVEIGQGFLKQRQRVLCLLGLLIG